MYICDTCGKTVEKIEGRYVRDEFDNHCRVYFGSIDAMLENGKSEYTETCERCGGDFVEAKECLICYAWLREDDDDICESCFKESSTIDTAYKFGGMDFLKSQFSERQIHDLLIRELREAEKLQPTETKSSIERYLAHNTAEFAKWRLENEEEL